MGARTTLLLCLVLIVSGIHLSADAELAELVTGKRWADISRKFADDSWKPLRAYFKNTLSVRFVTYPTPKLTYKAKFKTFAEIGTLIYEKKNNRYANLEITNQIKPLIFIENFKVFRVFNREITLGDARLFFRDGEFYLSQPYGQVLFYVGDWEFSILPSDPEEQITLTRLFGEKSIRETGNWGILILNDSTFLSDWTFEFQPLSRKSPVTPLLAIYREFFGIQIKQFREFWYLPFKTDDNLIILQKDKKSFYLYDYNPTLSPDTRLRVSENNRILLNYNAVRNPKLTIRQRDHVSRLVLNLFYNPESDFLSGTAVLDFDTPSSFRVLNLAEGLKIMASLDLSQKGLSVIRKGKSYYFLGPRTSRLSFFYKGTIAPDVDHTDVFRKQTLEVETVGGDDFYFLGNAQNFYPLSDLDFFSSQLTISLPKRFTCLASGRLTGTLPSSRNTFTFESDGIKGLALACGEFSLIREIGSQIPIRIFTTAGVRSQQFHLESFTEPLKQFQSQFESVSKYFDFKKLRDALDFLIRRYGEPDIPEINLLLRRDMQEGGISNKGFIFFNHNPDLNLSRRITRKSPIILSRDPTNHLIHELAHQWWGGMLSWETAGDVWITEGFAQFSLLHYLEKTLPKRDFSRILKRLKRDILRVNDAGPVGYGKRILSIRDDYEDYQTIVYNKGAMVLWMLKNLLGEKEFFSRTRRVLQNNRYQSLTGRDFIRQFSNGEGRVFDFLTHWITRRLIPELSVSIDKKQNRADITIHQSGPAVVFPLTLRIETTGGTVFRTVVVKEKKQVVPLRENSPIESIQIQDGDTLVRIKK